MTKIRDDDGKEKFHPSLPELFSRNVQYFLRADLKKTISLFLATIQPTSPPTAFSVKVLFRRKQRFWNVPRENDSAELVECLLPIFDALEISSSSNGSGVYSGRVNLSDLFWGKPVSPILFHLLDEAILILKRLISAHSANLKAADIEEDRDTKEGLIRKLKQRVQEYVSNTLNYIWKIVECLNTRLSAVIHIQAKVSTLLHL